MMRQLTQSELVNISGGEAVYPPMIPGYEIVGWTQTFLGWDVQTTTQELNFFDTLYVEQRTAVFDIQPIYSPIMTTTTTTVTYY
jgi:hypothetical protein